MVALARQVSVGNKSFAAGTDSAVIPVWALSKMTNPANWVGGVVPPGAHAAEADVNLSGLTASEVRSAVGLAAGRHVHEVHEFLNGAGSLATATATGGTVAAQSAADATAVGVVALAMTTTAASAAGVLTGAAAIAGSSGKHRLTARAKLSVAPAVSEDFLVRLGLLDAATAAPVDGVWFEVDRTGSATKWRVCSSAASTSTKVDTTVAFDASWHRFEVVLDGAAATPVANFFIDGVLVGQITTNLPLAAGNGFGYGAGVVRVGTGTAAQSVSVDYVVYDAELTSAR